MQSLYHYMDCPSCFKVRLYLAERSIPYQRITVKRDVPMPELAGLNPLRRLPVWMTEDDKPIFGSNTIIDYLESTHEQERLVPDDPVGRARCWMADELAVEGLLAPLLVLDREMAGKEPDRWDMKIYRQQSAKITRMLGVFEQLLGGRQWLVGDRMTVADLSVVLPLTILERFGLDLAAFAGLSDLRERIVARPSLAEARQDTSSSATGS